MPTPENRSREVGSAGLARTRPTRDSHSAMPFRSRDKTPRTKKSRARFASHLLDRLANEAFDCYLAWRSECAVLEAAYRRWLHASRSDAAFAYIAYTAALEREECAAGRYRTVVAEAENLQAQAGLSA